jgi:hypothetical protein
MAKTLTISQEHFKRGLQLLEDDSKSDFGSARVMENCMITDRGGIAPRPGTILLGDFNDNIYPIRGLYNFKKSRGDNDILTKFYDDEMEFFHPTLKTWARVKNGFTPDQEFDASYSLVNTDNDDFMYYCNAIDDYSRWSGAHTYVTEDLAGGETVIKVNSLLTSQIIYSATATGSSATTLVVSTATYATDMWKNFYIYIPSTGKVRLITGNNGTTITFATLGSDPGTVAFQIRQLAFPASGTVIYDGTPSTYTSIDVYNQLITPAAHAVTAPVPLTIVPTEYDAAPKGNRIDTLRGRVYVGRVRSGISRDSGGDVQGSSQASGVFVSKLLDPTDFTFAASRVAGEGDLISVVYGGGQINDVAAFEDEVAIYKQDYIELVKYSEDTDDYAIRTPLKPGYGSVSRVIQGADDHYFMRPDKQYTSLGRVRTKDLKPQTENIGYIIKRLLDTWNHESFNGVEFNNRLISSHKSSDAVNYNDVTLVFNKITKSFEGIWNIGANNFETFKEDGKNSIELVYGESTGANIWKMFQDRKVDKRGTDLLPYVSKWQSNFFNVTPIKSNKQAMNSIALEGYIASNTSFIYKLYKDFETDPIFSFTFGGTEENLLQGTSDIGKFYSSDPLGTEPLGTIGEEEYDGRRRFSFIIYFPFVYGQYFSTEVSSYGVDNNWEVIRMSYGLKEDVSVRTTNTKAV